MITHIIYHYPNWKRKNAKSGKKGKVGCTKVNLNSRKAWYYKQSNIDLEILEEIHDATDQEAGDREWFWADHFNYSRGPHYTLTIKAHHSPNSILHHSHQQKVTAGSAGGQRTMSLLNPEQRSALAKKARSSRKSSNYGGMNQRVTCPHCGLESNLTIMKRWHFDKCPKKQSVT